MSTGRVPLKCSCGRVRGAVYDVSPRAGNRVVCYCDDCQAFAWFLERSDVLDAHGGTDIFQVAPSRVSIVEGREHLRCVRLSNKGLYRWYTDCCKTPVANTIGARVPFVALIHPFMDHEADGRSRDEVLGAPIGILGKFAVGGLPPNAHAGTPPALIAKAARLLLWWLARGMGMPSPFFDSKTKSPKAEPRVLSPAERAALKPPAPKSARAVNGASSAHAGGAS